MAWVRAGEYRWNLDEISGVRETQVGGVLVAVVYTRYPAPDGQPLVVRAYDTQARLVLDLIDEQVVAAGGTRRAA